MTACSCFVVTVRVVAMVVVVFVVKVCRSWLLGSLVILVAVSRLSEWPWKMSGMSMVLGTFCTPVGTSLVLAVIASLFLLRSRIVMLRVFVGVRLCFTISVSACLSSTLLLVVRAIVTVVLSCCMLLGMLIVTVISEGLGPRSCLCGCPAVF